MKRLTCKWQFFNKTVIIESILIMLLLPLLFMKNPIPEASEHSLAIGVLLALMCSCIFKSLYRHKIIINTSNIDLLILLTLGYFLLGIVAENTINDLLGTSTFVVVINLLPIRSDS